MLRQMVVIGHSQGGLLTKSIAVDTGDQLWREFSANPLDDLKHLRSAARRTPAAAVSSSRCPLCGGSCSSPPHIAAAISTGGFARRLGRRLVSLPGDMVSDSDEMLKLTEGTEAEAFLEGKMPTSLDGMSPKNPALLAMAEIPVAPVDHRSFHHRGGR